MKSTRANQTQLRTLFFGLLCLLAGIMCVVKGYSHNSANLSAAVTTISGERKGVSPPSVILADIGKPQFTSHTPRYVTKRIADLEVGEEVVAKDTESGEITTKRVANVFRKVSDHLRILQVRNSLTNEVQTIETTDDHPFWVPALSQWIDAKDLKLGDRLDDVDNGTAILESTSRELHPDGIPVFNFEVEDFHTYFVRAHGSRGPPVLTHNTDCNFVSLESVEQAARVASARFDTSVATPGIAGLPGTGVFGDGAGFDVAFGIHHLKGGQSLPDFATSIGALHWQNWSSVGIPEWSFSASSRNKHVVIEAMDRANSVHFRIDGLIAPGHFENLPAIRLNGSNMASPTAAEFFIGLRAYPQKMMIYDSGEIVSGRAFIERELSSSSRYTHNSAETRAWLQQIHTEFWGN